MRIFGPLVCSTSLPVTENFARAAASAVTSVPSTTSSVWREISVPGSPSSFSTSTMSPTATLYCLPPVLTIAYIRTEVSCYSMVTGHAPSRLGNSPEGAHDRTRWITGRPQGYGSGYGRSKPGCPDHVPAGCAVPHNAKPGPPKGRPRSHVNASVLLDRRARGPRHGAAPAGGGDHRCGQLDLWLLRHLD